MRILYFTKYSRKGASSRMRSFQYFPYLESSGMKIVVKPLFSDEYLNALYSKNSKAAIVLTSYIKRFLLLFTVAGYDRVVIEKELFPYLPALFEWVLKVCGVKYLVDYDDAIFHNYDLKQNAAFKFLLGNKIKNVMRFAAFVTAGNEYLANYARGAGAVNVVVLPTVIDIEKYNTKVPADVRPVVIGWIGSPTTLKYLKGISATLKEICAEYDVKIHIIGGKAGVGLDESEEVIEWTEETEVDLIKDCDIGVMPLEDSLWEKGKCGYKLIQYMGCGLPVIASPVGVNPQIVQNGYNGFLVANGHEWRAAITKYISNRELRYEHGKNGRNIAAKQYSLQKTAPELYNILYSLK